MTYYLILCIICKNVDNFFIYNYSNHSMTFYGFLKISGGNSHKPHNYPENLLTQALMTTTLFSGMCGDLVKLT